jgi:MFS family permease
MTTGQPGQDPNAPQPPWGQAQYPPPQVPPAGFPQPHPAPGQYQPQYAQPQYPPGQYPPGQYPAAPPPWGMRPAAAPKPGSLALEPNDVGSTLSGVFSSLRNVLRAVWPGLIPLVVCSGVLGYLLAGRMLGPLRRDVLPSSTTVLSMLSVGLPLYLIQIAVSMLVLFATVRATADAVLGRRSDVGRTWRTSFRSMPRAAALFGLGVVASLLLGGAVVGLIFLAYAKHWATFALLLVVLILVAVAAALLVWLKLSLTVPAMVLEGDEQIGPGHPLDTRPAGLFASMGRSWRLTTGRAWRTLLIVWLMSLISGAVVGVVSPLLQVPIGLLTAAGDDHVATIGTAISGAIGSGLSILPTLATAITVTILYVDARIRDEQLAAAALGHLQHGIPANPWTVAETPAGPGEAPWAAVGIPPEQPPPS